MGNIEFQGKQKVCRWESTVRKGKKDKRWAWLYFLRQTPCWFLPQMSCEELPGATSGAVAEDRKEGWGGGKGGGGWKQPDSEALSPPPPVSCARSVPLSHCILQTFTLFKDKCIVNSVSPHTRYVRCSTPSTAKGLSPLLPTRHATNEIKWILLECRII